VSESREGWTMRVSVRFFAGLRDLAGTRQAEFELPEGATLGHLLPQVIERFPALEGQQAAWHYAVNLEHVEHDVALAHGDQVTIFPYIAGG